MQQNAWRDFKKGRCGNMSENHFEPSAEFQKGQFFGNKCPKLNPPTVHNLIRIRNSPVKMVPWFLVLVTIRPAHLDLLTIVVLNNLSTHIFLVPVTFSPRIFRPPLGWEVAWLSLVTIDPTPRYSWTHTFPRFLVGFSVVFFPLCC